MKEKNLEDKLIENLKEGKKVSLEKSLLIVSGLETEEEIKKYIKKIDKIEANFCAYLEDWYGGIDFETESDYFKAEFLFDYLWDTKPNRWGDSFRLTTEVIEAQLSEDKNQTIGDCLGLTSLYTILGLRQGLDFFIFCSPNHVLNIFKYEDEIIAIENSSDGGFDNYIDETEKFSTWPNWQLVSMTFYNRGYIKFEKGFVDESIEDFNKAIELNPEFPGAYNSRGVSKYNKRLLNEAIEDFNKAIELNPKYSKYYYNRGFTKENLGEIKAAEEDYRIYEELKKKEQELK